MYTAIRIRLNWHHDINLNSKIFSVEISKFLAPPLIIRYEQICLNLKRLNLMLHPYVWMFARIQRYTLESLQVFTRIDARETSGPEILAS